jgi:nucleoid DNA-binding protein
MAGKTGIVEELTNRGFSEKQAGRAVEIVLGELAECLARGERIELPGLGSFRAAGTPSRPSRRAVGESIRQLEEIQQLFELNLTELGRLFGASRQAVSSWLEKGVPSARKPKVHSVLNIAQLLERQLRPGRLPAVARRQAPAYGGLSILEMIGADRHEPLLERIRESFDWAATA